jgi:hypothetical protein
MRKHSKSVRDIAQEVSESISFNISEHRHSDKNQELQIKE